MSTASKPSLDGARILIVNNDRLNRSLLKTIFTAEGCRVSLADSGDAGLDTLATEAVDIVVLDLSMPGMNGVETVRRMRATASRVPIFILTSQKDLQVAVEATNLGADDFIIRPIENDELVMRVALTLRHRGAADELEILRTQAGIAGFIRDLIAHGEADPSTTQDFAPMPACAAR